MDGGHRIAGFLADVRRRLQRRAALRAGLIASAGLIALAVLTAWWAAEPTATRGARALGGAALATLLGAGLWQGVLRPRRRFAADGAVARWVGRRAPELASDLLSCVELGGGARVEQRAAPVSTQLIAALTDATARRTDALVPEVLVDRRPLRRPLGAMLAAVALAGLLVGLAPERVRRGIGNLIAPSAEASLADAESSGAPLVGDLAIRLEAPAYAARPPVELPSASGDFRALPGTLVRLRTTALVEAEQAFLVLDGEEPGNAMVPLEVEGRTLRGQFVVGTATRYRFLLVDGQGHRRIERHARAIEIEVDAPPTVELHAPADELDVTGLKRIELAYQAEDDHGLGRLELVWQGTDGVRRQPLLPDGIPPRNVQDKLYWDLAEVGLRPGAQVSYWIEARDNDTVRGPNKGESRRFSLRILSPRERHERLLASQREVFERLVKLLADRLTLAPGNGETRAGLLLDGHALGVELGRLVAALEKDELADRKLRGFLAAARARLDRATAREEKALKRSERRSGPLAAGLVAQLAGPDRALVAGLEDDVLALADWLDRQDLEALLALSDEIATHRERLSKLMEEFARTGSKEIAAEIERELRALEQLLAEQGRRQSGVAEDVLDQFVNTEALDRKENQDCLADVRRLVAAGDAVAAKARMAECGAALDRGAAALEEALGELRGDRFGAEQKKLEDLQRELSELGEDQREIAARLDALSKRYGELAAARMKAEAGRVAERLGDTLDKLQRRLAKVPEAGMGAFEKEELGAVKTRIGDLGKMLADGDLAEALAMARQAEVGLETIAGELGAALENDPAGRRETQRALDEIARAQPLAAELVDELDKATPSPGEILGKGELEQLDKLRKAQQAAAARAARLRERTGQMAGELPGQAGAAIGQRLEKAEQAMGRAEGRMKARDPSGARPEARAAADALEAAGEDARGAARLRQAQGRPGMRDEPVRIPGAEEYRAPVELREQIMEAMKRKGEAPSAYGEMLRRYYEELAR